MSSLSEKWATARESHHSSFDFLLYMADVHLVSSSSFIESFVHRDLAETSTATSLSQAYLVYLQQITNNFGSPRNTIMAAEKRLECYCLVIDHVP